MYRVHPGLRLVLASASPRRQEMLSRIGLAFDLEPAETDESILAGETAEQSAQRLALAKARAAAGAHPQAAVLAADTLVVLGQQILGKPTDPNQARDMLASLSGREHQVVTGYCLLLEGEEECGRAISRVRFRNLSHQEIEAYLASGEPLDKAGAYGVQGLGAVLVEEVSGSYTNVVGLPLAAVVKLLLARGVIEPWPKGDA